MAGALVRKVRGRAANSFWFIADWRDIAIGVFTRSRGVVLFCSAPPRFRVSILQSTGRYLPHANPLG
jgi:hypothetical protein